MFEMDENVIDRARGYEVLAEIFLKEPSTEGMEGLKAWTDSGSTEKLLELKAILEKIQNEDSELMNLTQEYYDLFLFLYRAVLFPPSNQQFVERSVKRVRG